MKKYQSFQSENVSFLEMKFSIYLNRRVFVMLKWNEYTHKKRLPPSDKGSFVKGKKNAPFIEDLFSSGLCCARKQTGSQRNCLPCKIGRKTTKGIKSL